MPRMRSFIRFIVQGWGAFPFDMLRQAECWPSDERSARSMAQNHKHAVRVVCLTTLDHEKIAPDRWRKFGWGVIEVSNVAQFDVTIPPAADDAKD